MNPHLPPSILPAMVIESTTDLGSDAIQNPGKYAGFMGISVGHKFFSKTTMEYFLHWGSHIFKEFIVILLDEPDTYNFMVFESMEYEEARKKARTIGDEKRRAFEKVVRKIGVSNVKILCFRDYSQNSSFKKILETTHTFVKTNAEFKKDLYQLIMHSIGNKIELLQKERSLSPLEVIQVQDTLADYIIEEFSSLLYFTENGYPIEVDPTREFSTKSMIYNHTFPNFTELLSLSTRGHIYVHPEGILKSTY